MYINEYGDKSSPKILMLHPMEVTGDDLYHLFSKHLSQEYYCISPDQGGHGKSKGYISAQAEVKELADYLVKNNLFEFDLLYAASMGCAVAVQLIQDKRFTFKKIWFDGCFISEKGGFMNLMMRSMFLKKLKQFEKNPELEPTNLIKLYGKDMGYMMKNNFVKFSKEDITNICYACCHYKLAETDDEVQERIHIEWGENDMDYKSSKKGMAKYYPKVTPVIRSGYGHCGYMAFETKKYVSEIEKFMA